MGRWSPPVRTGSRQLRSRSALDGAYTYYINIIADNHGGPGYAGGNPDALLGQLSVTGNYQFAGGSQTLVTGASGWTASANDSGEQLYAAPDYGSLVAGFPLPPSSLSWTAPTGTPVVLGVNGGSNIWDSVNGGPVGGISTNAYWIWSPTDPSGEAFFQTSVTMSAIPELSTWAMMLAGFAGLGFAGYRRSRRNALPAA